jgi:hypothetical protein
MREVEMNFDPEIRLPKKTLETLEFILNPTFCEIIQALGTVLRDADEIAAWIHTPNPNFEGQRPVERMLLAKGDEVLEWVKASIKKNFVVEPTPNEDHQK